MSQETQIKKMVTMMKKGKVKNWEFMRMYVGNHTARISDIRAMGYKVQKERLYDGQGKATGTFQYWIPRTRRPVKVPGHVVDGMSFEQTDKDNEKSNWLQRKLKIVR